MKARWRSQSVHAGFRIGKGEGYADMEFGMMASMDAVSDSTVVVTVVHDCQVSDRLATPRMVAASAGSFW